jgi:hypothetical protein
MKNKILFSAMLCIACTFSIHVNAQLQVNSNGQTKVTKQLAVNGANITDSVALNVNAAITSGSKKYGVYSYREVQNPISISERGANICILGQVRPLTHSGEQVMNFPSLPALNPLFVGVAGLASTGVGVYGATGSYIPATWTNGNYAGYFSGDVKVTGTLTATTSTTSDLRLKENVTNLNNNLAIDILSQLRPVSFTFKRDSTIFYTSKDSSRIHYGLIAQEVRTILPDLVSEDGAGYLSVNYTELIPFLLQAINAQQTQIEALSEEINMLSNNSAVQKVSAKGRSNNLDVEQALLYQNNPNPFTIDTEIEYFLPQNTQVANLYVYNMNGLQIAEYPISSFGSGSVVINAGNLDAGMYLYSLIADGQIVDTKRMILTK